MRTYAEYYVACENIRFSNLFAAGDLSHGGTFATQRQKFHTDLEPHDYRIYDKVNIDLRHQYGISVAESQTFLLAKRPHWRRARRNGSFRKLHIMMLNRSTI